MLLQDATSGLIVSAMNMDAFFKLHCDMPREGPGSDDATREALARLRTRWTPPSPAGARPSVMDVGCGPGQQTLVLARELGLPVLAVDFYEVYLERLCERARAAGLDRLITPLRAGMEALDLPTGGLDLIWAEGSIYIIGFASGLSLWRPMLREGGFVAASELTWLTDDPPAEVRAFWEEGYPPMTNVEGNIRNAASVGFEVFDHFVLPQAVWWDEYLTPLSARADRLRAETADCDLLEVIAEQDRETDMVRRFGEHFGYVFYLMQKTAMPPAPKTPHAH